jgi:hypothetical protein
VSFGTRRPVGELASCSDADSRLESRICVSAPNDDQDAWLTTRRPILLRNATRSAFGLLDLVQFTRQQRHDNDSDDARSILHIYQNATRNRRQIETRGLAREGVQLTTPRYDLPTVRLGEAQRRAPPRGDPLERPAPEPVLAPEHSLPCSSSF